MGQFYIETDGRRRALDLPTDHLSIADVLRAAGSPLNTRCSGRRTCDGCLVECVQGALVHLPTGRRVEAAVEAWRRACEHAPLDGAVIHIPLRSLLGHRPLVVADFQLNITGARDPLCQVANGELGAAIDVGTTTVAIALVEMATGRILSRCGGLNRQIELGDDVVTRIGLCAQGRQTVDQLQRLIVEQTVAPLLLEASRQANVDPERIACCAVAGNTTMLHLFAGVDPSSIGVAPFTPVFLEHRLFRSPLLACPAHLLPGPAAYIGADIAAGAVATGLLYEPGPSLLVDAGTNGEVLLKTDGRVIGCATAAGPAFEGAGLDCGLRAGRGAISHLRINRGSAVELEIIGTHDGALGLCGSAYIDFLAQARAGGILDEKGRFKPTPRASLRLTPQRGQAMHLSNSIFVSEADIASLLSAKAAIAAGILTLLDRTALTPRDLQRVYLAGGFGSHLQVPNAIACGLLPGFNSDQVVAVGNSSLAGAYLALLDRGAIHEMERLQGMLEVVELNLDPSFEERYIDNLRLP